jgi:hypothetical protein
MMKKQLIVVTAMLTLAACQQQAKEEKKEEATEAKKEQVSATEKIPLTRDSVSKQPVAQFSQKTDNPLNDWYFSVKLYETPKTFSYLMRLQFEEITGEDTLRLPNLGIMPKPVIQKGPDKYSCIIGFMDNENKFREYKKVYVKDNTLKVTALKHYAVYEK